MLAHTGETEIVNPYSFHPRISITDQLKSPEKSLIGISMILM